MLSIVMLNVVMLSVVAPLFIQEIVKYNTVVVSNDGNMKKIGKFLAKCTD